MKHNILLLVLLGLLMPAGVMAKDMTGSSFPYGMLELRGYAMEMSEEGKFRIYSGTTTFVKGTFSIDGNKMTIFDTGGQYACRGKRMNPGSYYWTVHDHGLYLMLIRDNCGARRTAFLEAPLRTGRAK